MSRFNGLLKVFVVQFLCPVVCSNSDSLRRRQTPESNLLSLDDLELRPTKSPSLLTLTHITTTLTYDLYFQSVLFCKRIFSGTVIRWQSM